ncbi:MAG: SDR family oxidoreductase [Rhodospirillaceae bacterium]|jgi:citronellol/citronellal dehydrogenase|nr:SDR family oxidoreductase [Rhodospirillaceae bacterium]
MTQHDDHPEYGFSDDDLRAMETVYKPDLFAGKTVIVSGAGSGLGKAIATLFAKLGANLVICGRNEERLAEAHAFFESLGGQVFSQAMSIRDPEQVDTFVEAAFKAFGGVDVLVNNAGGQFPQAAIDFKPKGWNAVIDTNLNGTWYMIQAAARRWIDTGVQGNVVNIVADIWRGMPGIAHTAAARAGVVYLSKSIAVEWAPHGIRVNCVAPGCCETTAFALYPPEGAASYKQSNPMLKAGDAWDIAEAAVYVAAPSGKFVTGEVITVDGGQQLWGDPWPTGRPEYFKLKD